MKQHASKFQKILACMLIVTLLCILCSCSKQSTGAWQQVTMKDEFGDEIKDSTYCSIDAEGTFSKPDVTEGKLQATVCAAKEAVWIVLHEDKNSVVTNTTEKTVHYTVSIKNDAGEVYQFDGRMGTESEKISFGQFLDWDNNLEECIQLLTHLCGNGSLKFSIVNENNKLIKYNFTIPCDQRADGVNALAAHWYTFAEEFLSSEKFDRAEELFGLLGGYKDSADRVLEVRYARAENWLSYNEYDKAEEAFAALGSYKDAAKRVLDVQEARNADAYAEAEKLLADKKYDWAEEAFKALGDYSDAEQRVLDVQEARNADKYAKAEALLSAKNYDAAEAAFNALGNYSDAVQRVVDVQNARNAEKYATAEALLTEKNYDAAEKAFAALGNYSDSVQRVIEVQDARNAEKYAAAEALLNEKNYDAAEEAFAALGNYSDAVQRVTDVQNARNDEKYAAAEAMLAEKKYDAAEEAFAALGSYSDAVQRIADVQEARNEDKYAAAEELKNTGKYEDAIAAFEDLRGYKNSAAEIIACETAIKDLAYDAAIDLKESESYAKAIKEFAALSGYRDSAEQIVACQAAREAKLASFKKIDSFVTFGTYEQDNNETNGYEAIEWQVLDVQGNQALLISRYGLEVGPYNTEYRSITWEKSLLRSWLNKVFLSTAFSLEEQEAILTTRVDNSKRQGYSEWDSWKINSGNDTYDKLFLLSYAEANKYYEVTRDNKSNTASRMEPTAYAKAYGAEISNSNKTTDGAAAGWWWLRSPGSTSDTVALVSDAGSLTNYAVIYQAGCVRPAFWIDLDAEIF